MLSFSSFIQRLFKINWQLKKINSSQTHPKNLVRFCRNQSEFINIINEAISSENKDWDESLIDRVIKYILEGGEVGISVYSSDTLDPFDYGHALAVIAEGISQKKFRSNSSKRETSCTRGSLIIPTDYLPKNTIYEFTPENNLDFYPANNHHFDLTINDAVELATVLLNGINQGVITWSILGGNLKFKGTYQFQSVIAYSHCIRKFGKLNPDIPPSEWSNGKNLTASEQIDTIKYLAQTKLVDSPAL